ncbi:MULTISPECIES: ABC transporter ATP-binding protein [Haloferacaceae]|uniref:ABC transporter ATP-binding protein n=1 Tax=Halorubrum glutamatedens TaxID=2707018 RepID=A0ABD5QN64_9EURY|nr:ABC transporter ATP-binding protein [Halobellus captivus]
MTHNDASTTSVQRSAGTDNEPDFGPNTLLKVRNLSTRFFTDEGQVNAVESLDFEVKEGEVFGIVGESGSGKSVTGLSILDLIESPGRITDGEIWFRNRSLADEFNEQQSQAVRDEFVNLLELPESVHRSLRGNSFSMIFQDPMSSFDPTSTVGEQIAEAVEVQQRTSSNPRSARSRTQGYGFKSMVLGSILPSKSFVTEPSMERAIELLELVGIPDPKKRAQEYPHQFSGGMLQRAMIAQALAGEPDLLIADEPTTALDVTIQAQILSLLSDIQEERGMSVILITHNLGVVARVADRLGVMYAGEIAERGTLKEIFENHTHPYTAGLLGSIPEIDEAERLRPIPGNVPSLLDHEMGDRCYFADRCPKAMEECMEKPPEYEINDDHRVRCYLANREFDEDRSIRDHFDGEGGEPS